MAELITSTSNKGVRHVRDLQTKAKLRRETGCFVAEGERICSELSPEMIERVFVAEHYKGTVPQQLPDKLTYVSDSVMAYMADTKTSQGILAVVRQKHYSSLPGDCFMILENIQDPGNLGTIFRTAEAAGVSGLLLSRDCADVYAPKVVRSTMGAIYRVPFVIADDMKQAVLSLKQRGVHVYAAHLKGETPHFACDFKAPCAFMIGNEGNGLTDALAALADSYIRIPMQGSVESLNAAVAASVLMFEAARQRYS